MSSCGVLCILDEVQGQDGDVTSRTGSGSDSDDSDVIYVPFEVKRPRMARPEECQVDDEVLQMQPETSDDLARAGAGGKDKDNRPKAADWRFGPAQLWYDMLGVSETGEEFDYGFTLKKDEEQSQDETTTESDAIKQEEPSTSRIPVEKTDVSSTSSGSKVEFPVEASTMVSQVHWEDDVIYNGEEVKQTVLSNAKKAGAVAGWIPSSACRSLSQYLQQSECFQRNF